MSYPWGNQAHAYPHGSTWLYRRQSNGGPSHKSNTKHARHENRHAHTPLPAHDRWAQQLEADSSRPDKPRPQNPPFAANTPCVKRKNGQKTRLRIIPQERNSNTQAGPRKVVPFSPSACSPSRKPITPPGQLPRVRASRGQCLSPQQPERCGYPRLSLPHGFC